MKINTVLISVTSKRGLSEFSRSLVDAGVTTILSTGGTYKWLEDNGIPSVVLKKVEDVTGFPEMMGGRVKTLHPKIHGGLLGRDVDEAVMEEHGIPKIDMVVVNLYPFTDVVKNPSVDFKTAIENIDIGGPAMLRSAAKNFGRCIPVPTPEFYPHIISALAKTGMVNENLRYEMMTETFAILSNYDFAISKWLNENRIKQL